MKRVLVVGFDDREFEALRNHLDMPLLRHYVPPRIQVIDGQLAVENPNAYLQFLSVSQVVFHGIYEDDWDFILGLTVWGGPTLPRAHSMMDSRLKIPCLLRALQFTQFGQALRGFLSANTPIQRETMTVAKWGNWHCGENKDRFRGGWQPTEQAVLLEPYFEGDAVRVVIIGNQAWQIRLTGETWLKSIHPADADFMPLDDELLADTQNLANGLGLEIIATDYIWGTDGQKHLLEVNHIPNITRFEPIRQAYLDYVVGWVAEQVNE